MYFGKDKLFIFSSPAFLFILVFLYPLIWWTTLETLKAWNAQGWTLSLSIKASSGRGCNAPISVEPYASFFATFLLFLIKVLARHMLCTSPIQSMPWIHWCSTCPVPSWRHASLIFSWTCDGIHAFLDLWGENIPTNGKMQTEKARALPVVQGHCLGSRASGVLICRQNRRASGQDTNSLQS